MLVVMHHRNVQRTFQTFFDIEALRCLDILEVNTAKGGGNTFYSFAELFRVFLVNLNIKHIDTTIDFKEQALSFHHGFTTQGTNITQSQHSCSVRDDSH